MIDLSDQQFDRYRLVRRLGFGGFASVYLGQHVLLESKQAAIKILHLTEVDVDKFRQEANITATLDHPHIVRLLDFDIQQEALSKKPHERYASVMQFAEALEEASKPLPALPIETQLLIYRGHSDEVYTLAWSPDGSHLASGLRDKTMQVWEVSSGRLLRTYPDHSVYVMTLAWAPDGSRLPSGSSANTVQVWQAE